MTMLYDLLLKGYFPKELPPPFRTESFANLILSNLRSLPSDYSSGNVVALSCEHNIALSGMRRRKLGILNPIPMFRLCKGLYENWPELSRHIESSRISLSKPKQGGRVRRAFSPMYPPNSISEFRAHCRLGKKYLLKTDITNYYNSIYTHSIAWALNGKQESKTNRSENLLGNKLDRLIRDCQSQQTVGIPTGPDTSFLLSEILLSAVDAKIMSKLSRSRIRDFYGFRYMDDYEFCFSNYNDSEIALNQIDSALSEFELSLNSRKTIIKKLPAPLEEDWVRDLKIFEFRDNLIAQRNDIISYFSRAFSLAEENPDKSVLRYAIAKFRSIKIDINAWELLQDLLLNCVSCEPGTIQYVLEQFIKFSNSGYPIKLKELGYVLNDQINTHAPLNHGGEVAWTLWGAIVFEVPLHANASELVSEMDDSVVALLALDAEQRGYFEKDLRKDNWSQYSNKEGLYGDKWLLSYEANINDWIPIAGRDHVNADSRFNYLKRNGVRFYDGSKCAKVIPEATQSMHSARYNISIQ